MGKKTIEFFSSIEGVTEAFPIQQAKEVIPPWVNDARKDFVIAQKNVGPGFQHVTRCPGIFHLFTTGYIVSMWHDVEITGKGITVPDKQINTLLGKDTIGVQDGNSIAKHLPKRPWSRPDIVKINTPWHVIAPKDVKFLMIPMPYTDHIIFESCIGILDPGYSTEINIQGYWNQLIGSTMIKAGTPIAQLIPLTEKSYNFIVRDKNKNDELWLKKREYLNFFSFQYARNLIKKLYESHVRNNI